MITPEEEQQNLVYLTNTEYLRMLMQTDPQYRDRIWCYQLEEQLKRMEFISFFYHRFENERKILNETYENLKETY